MIRDFKSEVGGRSGDVPVAQRVSQKIAFEVASNFGLQVASILGPVFQKRTQLFQFDEQVIGRSQFGDGIGKNTAGIAEIGGCVGGPADAAVVTRLIRRTAFGAGAADEAVGKECAGDGVEELFDACLLYTSDAADE